MDWLHLLAVQEALKSHLQQDLNGKSTIPLFIPQLLVLPPQVAFLDFSIRFTCVHHIKVS